MTNKQSILILCIAQIVAPLIFILASAFEYISFETAKGYYVPYLFAGVIGFAPFAALAMIPKFQNNIQIKLVAAIAATVHGTQGLIAFDNGAYWLSGFSKILMYLSIASSVTGIGLAVLLFLDLKINKSMLAEVSDRWRVVPGFLALLFLLIETPGRVLDDQMPFLSLVLFPIIISTCLLTERYRQGAIAGLAITIASSLIGRASQKILNSGSYESFISIPSFLALGLCLLVIAPNSMFQQKQTSVPR